MGRQPYLTRLALGRSAFEPPTPGTFPTLNRSSQGDSADQSSDAPQEYLQLYDEAGRPINPRSQAYGRRLRAAQNDVFAAFGVVQRKEQEASSLEDEEGDSESEELTADTISAFTHSPVHFFTWWITALKARFMALDIPSNTSLVAIVQSEYREYGSSLLHRGLPLVFIFNLTRSYFNYELSYSRLLDQLLFMAKASPRRRRMFSKTTVWGTRIFSFLTELAILPLGYYSTLQTMGLAPAKWFPPRTAFTPGSANSPWPKLSYPSELSLNSIFSCFVSLVMSPAMVLILSSRLNSIAYNASRRYIPSYDDIQSRLLQPRAWGEDERDSKAVARILGGDDRPLLTRTLSFLGWGFPLPNIRHGGLFPVIETTFTPPMTADQHVSNLASDSMVARPPDQHGSQENFLNQPPRPPRNPIATFHDILADEASTELPPSPGQRAQVDAWTTAITNASDHVDVSGATEDVSNRPQEIDEPAEDSRTRVRITTREPGTLTVELEIDAMEVDASSEQRPATTETILVSPLESSLRPHRVSRLTKGPSKFLADMLAIEIATLIDLPFKLISFRFCALYFASSTASSITGAGLRIHCSDFWLAQLSRIGLKSLGAFAYRMLFCSVASLAVDLAVWGLNYGLTRSAGIRHYRWGQL